MHAVILAAGEGSRMGLHTGDVPKAFMDIGDRTLYDRQRAALEEHVDDVTVVLGYAYENVVDRVESANVVVLEDWAEYDNGESLRRALERIDDDVLVLNGDVIVTEPTVERLTEYHAARRGKRSVVACISGYQEESTAIRCDDRGLVTDYGMIRGHRHAGLGIVDRSHVALAERYLRRHRTDWYPVIYPYLRTDVFAIPASNHIEINRPRDVLIAKRKLPLGTTGEADAQT